VGKGEKMLRGGEGGVRVFTRVCREVVYIIRG
jgi:hypothetical protein